MKFTCTQENLSQGLTIVSHIASKNTNLPILNNLLLRAEKSGVELAATNLEIGVTTRIRGKVEQEGVFTIPARIMAEYVGLLGQERVEVELDGTTLHIKSGTAETQLRGMPAEEFPLIPSLERSQAWVCDAQQLREALSQVIFAAATDDTRPEISGVFLRFSAKELVLAATDSYRLAEKHVPLQSGREQEQTAIVPVKSLQELVRLLGQEGETVSCYLSANQILFVYQDSELISRLIDGQYPDYRQIIPEHHETRVTMKTAECVQAVRATSLFSRPGINDLTVGLHPDTNTLSLQAANAQVGQNRQQLAAQVEGIENTIVFNGRYLLDGLTNMNAPEATLAMTNSASPGILRPADAEDYLYIIMPIKQ